MMTGGGHEPPGEGKDTGHLVSLRMRLGFDDVETFEAGYRRFVTAKGIFLASRTPRAKGTRLRFELQTRGGERLLVAEGQVVAVREPDPDNPRRVPGMHVRFTRLTQESRERLRRMTAAGSPPPVEPASEPDREPRSSAPLAAVVSSVDPDSLDPPAPAPFPGFPKGRSDPRTSTAPTEPPLDLPDPKDSTFRNVFQRLFGMGTGGPPPDDPFAHAARADLPTSSGDPLDDIPELETDSILPHP